MLCYQRYGTEFRGAFHTSVAWIEFERSDNGKTTGLTIVVHAVHRAVYPRGDDQAVLTVFLVIVALLRGLLAVMAKRQKRQALSEMSEKPGDRQRSSAPYV